MTDRKKMSCRDRKRKFEDPLTIAAQSRDDPHGGRAGTPRGERFATDVWVP